MKRFIAIIFAISIITGCGKNDDAGKIPKDARNLVQHADFTFMAPLDWNVVEKESTKDKFVFQSQDGKSKLTISMLYCDKALKQDEVANLFKTTAENKRKAELEAKPSMELSDTMVGSGKGYLYAKFAGVDKSHDRSSATLITSEKGKIFTLYLELAGTNKDSVTAISNDIFSNFNVK